MGRLIRIDEILVVLADDLDALDLPLMVQVRSELLSLFRVGVPGVIGTTLKAIGWFEVGKFL